MPNSLPIGRPIVHGDRFKLADVKAQWAERRAAIAASYRETISMDQTARAFGISKQRVAEILTRDGIARTPRGRHPRRPV